MTLRESKQLIRRWISERFSDERLAEVYAFNQDGRMRFLDPCGCLLGVTGAETLHSKKCSAGWPPHYAKILHGSRFAHQVQDAYNVLGWAKTISVRGGAKRESEDWRRIRLGAIPRAQMRLRARTRQQELVPAR